METDRLDRRSELLAGRALGDLSDAELAELDALLAATPNDDAASFELASAALELARLRSIEPMPPHVASAIERASANLAPPSGKVVALAKRRAGAVWIPWGVAASFAIAFAASIATRPSESSSGDRDVDRVSALAALVRARECPSAAAAPSAPAPKPSTSIAPPADARVVAWTPTKDAGAKGASGQVAWSASTQTGAMTFRGLRKNDPRVSQYQLWIFDADRDEKYPVDGGVFDVDGDEVVVPITPKVAAHAAKLFAITIERPGGVVVSKREHIVLTAAL